MLGGRLFLRGAETYFNITECLAGTIISNLYFSKIYSDPNFIISGDACKRDCNLVKYMKYTIKNFLSDFDFNAVNIFVTY